ncbi:MAG: YicC family protein [Myxococcota bacterium]
MISSMTGYGRAKDSVRGLYVELKSVNHRFCEVKTLLPRYLGFLEIEATKYIKERAARGFFTVVIGGALDELFEPEIRLNEKLLDVYIDVSQRASRRISEKTGVNLDIPKVDRFLRFEGVIENIAEPPVESIWQALKPLFDEALSGLLAMRREEGATIAKELTIHIERCAELIAEIEKEMPQANETIKRRLEKNLSKALLPGAMDEGRVAQEIAFIVERSDITEELNRSRAHIGQFKKLLKADGKEPAGRKLDFILQELNRESNTIASKSQDLDIALKSVELRSEIEKAREQVQNIE